MKEHKDIERIEWGRLDDQTVILAPPVATLDISNFPRALEKNKTMRELFPGHKKVLFFKQPEHNPETQYLEQDITEDADNIYVRWRVVDIEPEADEGGGQGDGEE